MDRRIIQATNTRRTINAAAVLAIGFFSSAGCGHSTPPATTMTSDIFVKTPGAYNDGSALSASTPVGPITNDNPPVTPETSVPKIVSIPPLAAVGERNVAPVSPLENSESAPVHADAGKADANSSDQARVASAHLDPSSVPTTSSGEYMCVGGVVARVGQTPIYACQILKVLDKELTAKGKVLTQASFKQYAREAVERKLFELIQDEIDFITADKALGKEDKDLARQIAVSRRHDRVSAAGGSEQVARKKLADEGSDFDEECRQEYRHIVYELYQERMIEPLIQVSPDDMREFYNHNVAKLYTQKEQIQFRVIQIRPESVGGDSPVQLAFDKITGIREKAVRGDDFAALASTDNDDSYLKSKGGNVGWMDRGAFVSTAVDDAVWKLDAGQVTDVINDHGVFFIAKVDQKKLNQVRPFDDQTVQDEIKARLRQQQMSALTLKMRNEARDENIISPNEIQIDLAVDMAMQKYAAK